MKVRSVNVQIVRNRRQEDPGDPADREEPNETDRKEHRGRVMDLPAEERRSPRKDFDSGRHADYVGQDHEGQLQERRQPGCEHVVRPDHEAQQRDRHRGERDQFVAEDRLAGESRQDLGDDPERRKHHNVDGRMRVEPEHVLPHDRAAAFGRIEERHPELTLDEERGKRRRERRRRDHQQRRGCELAPVRRAACA